MLTLLATNLVTNATQALNKVNLSNPTWDVFLILFFITFAFLYGIFLGRDKIVNLIIATFFAYMLAINLNFMSSIIKNLTSVQFSIISLIFFIIFIVILFFFIVKKSILSSVSLYISSWWHIIVFSFIHTGLLISLSLSLLDPSLLKVFGLFITNIFINPVALFVWISSSILSLIFLKNSSD